MTSTYHIAQLNIARLLAPIDDPLVADFVNNLDRINTLGESSLGFVWRLKDDTGNATAIKVYPDPRIIVNLTVWESIDALFDFTYKSRHVDIFRRRAEWFEPNEHIVNYVLWWIPAGTIPTVAEAKERLEYLRKHGPTPYAFSFKKRFPIPEDVQPLSIK